MWSDLYFYYNIRKDDEHSEILLSKTVVDTISKTKEFKKVGPQSFKNYDDCPFVHICCVYSSNGGWSHKDSDSTEFCNEISITMSKHREANVIQYTATLLQIAQELNWKLTLDEDDNGNTNLVL